MRLEQRFTHRLNGRLKSLRLVNMMIVTLAAGLVGCHEHIGNGSARSLVGHANRPSAARVSHTGAEHSIIFTNSLGLLFVAVPGLGAKVCIWETRVIDFTAFVCDTGYDASAGMFSPGRDGWKQRGHTWLFPGFSQRLDGPVGGVSVQDAEVFCQWLTARERKAGLLNANQRYRLPVSDEWAHYVGNGQYPWGDQFPPYGRDGMPLANVAGQESSDENFSPAFRITGYNDGFARTSPVGSFEANELGIHDTGGNVKELCGDLYSGTKLSKATALPPEHSGAIQKGVDYRVLVGSGWSTGLQDQLVSRNHVFPVEPNDRVAGFGFRLVLASE